MGGLPDCRVVLQSADHSRGARVRAWSPLPRPDRCDGGRTTHIPPSSRCRTETALRARMTCIGIAMDCRCPDVAPTAGGDWWAPCQMDAERGSWSDVLRHRHERIGVGRPSVEQVAALLHRAGRSRRVSHWASWPWAHRGSGTRRAAALQRPEHQRASERTRAVHDRSGNKSSTPPPA
jgi:hypothetical protein